MLFSSPADPEVTSVADTSSGRAFFLARQVGRFASVQVFVQLIGFATGILLVRLMEQREYALFTVTNTMQGTMNILADIGISIGMISIGGRVWQDSRRFGELVQTGLKLRRTLGAIAVIAITPLLYYMLAKNGASPFYAIVLIGAVLLDLSAQLSIGVLEVVPRLRSDIRMIQKIDLIGAISRLLVLLVLAGIFLNAGVAAFVGSAALLLQFYLLRRYATGVVEFSAQENAEDRQAMIGFIRQQAANAIFYCLQGQITVFLITVFGHRVGVAEVGALGRLAMIYSVVANLIMNIFAPAFARCQDPRRLGWIYAGIVTAVAGFSLVVLGGAILLPGEFLFVLGNKYSHLHWELFLMVAGASLTMMTSTLWYLNACRAWIAGSWLNIPLTIAAQIFLIPFLDFSTVAGVLTFNLFAAVPSLLLNIGLSYRGFREHHLSGSIKVPNFGYHVARWEGGIRRKLYETSLSAVIARRIEPAKDLPLDIYSYSSEAMLPEQVRSIRSLLRFAGRPQSFTVVSDGTHCPRSIELLREIDPVVRVRPVEEFRPASSSPKFDHYIATHPIGKQLGLIMSLPRSGPALYLDADVLFFPGAADLIVAAQPHRAPALYLPDCRESSVDPRVLRGPNEYKNPANCGLLFLFQTLDWSLCFERFHELDGEPDFFTNQTLIHLVMHANGAESLDPERYVLQLDDQFGYRDLYATPAIVLRHYVNPVRHKFWNAS
jgi:O-antigen/teichoic acid export membrane protein